ncbi:MAG: hypothetical protein R2748_16250 [Bryobacterales bacterium]
MPRIALGIVGLIVLLAGGSPSLAQLVIDRSKPAPYPMPPKIEVEEEENKPKEPPRYSGETTEIPAECDPARLSALGLPCSAASPCEMSLELTAAGEAGEAVIAIGDLYSPSATIASVVLRSDDGGASWTEAHERITGAALDELHFSGEENAWIVGRENIGGGQRPFLLASDDGGKSWRLRPIDEDEDFRGSVLQLRFDSPEHGFLILEKPTQKGDPYELRESFNGGRSWSLRQVTAERPALPGSRRRTPEPSVRVSEPAADNLFLVERREAGEWRTLGRFSAKAGVCGGQ